MHTERQYERIAGTTLLHATEVSGINLLVIQGYDYEIIVLLLTATLLVAAVRIEFSIRP